MNLLRYISYLLFLSIFLPDAARASGDGRIIRIVQGGEDTVFSANHLIIGTVPPKSKLLVNGSEVKVYKTGTFGFRPTLTNGHNRLNLVCIRKGQQQARILDIFCDPLSPKAGNALPEGSETSPMRPVSLTLRTLPGAFLTYGRAGDRLGGTKMGYLDEGMLLPATAEDTDHYRIQLSGQHYAYLPKEYARIYDPCRKNLPEPCASGSWSVRNTGRHDKITVSLDEMKPYAVREENNPHRLVVELFGVQCNSNWITQYPGLASISEVRFEQPESDVMKLIVDLSRPTSWGYSVGYEGNDLVIRIKHVPDNISLRKMKIGLDAGHGGKSTGAVSPAGYEEKKLNMDMVLMLRKILRRKGAEVVLSRTGDRDMSMAQRKAVFRQANIDLMLSIHCNAGGDPLSTGGTSTYYKHWPNRELASRILNSLLALKDVRCFGLVGNFNFSLAAPTEYPAVLVETLFLSNPRDEERIVQKKFQRKMMKKVADGLKDYLEYCTEIESKSIGGKR